MKIDLFEMERAQCLYEHAVELNLSESGVLPLKLGELLEGEKDVEAFLNSELWYCEADGSHLFRERIAQFYDNCQAENITVTNGSSEAIYVTLWTLLEKEGRLAFMVPNYMQGWGLGRAYAGGVDTFQLVLQKEEEGYRWALDVDSFKRAVTEETKVIMITNPNNPTGSVLNSAEMDLVVEVARKAGAWLMVDEVYRGAEVSGETTPSFWGRYEKVIITSGLSKAFGLPGLRTGWVVAPPELISELWVRHDYLTLTPAILSDRLGTRALEEQRREEILARTRKIIRNNLPPIEDWLQERRDLFTYARPQAGAIVFCNYNTPIKSLELFNRMRVEQSVLLTPGEHFGLEHGLRFGYGYDVEKTLKGLERTEAMLRSLT